jgi:hypothetical protein
MFKWFKKWNRKYMEIKYFAKTGAFQGVVLRKIKGR